MTTGGGTGRDTAGGRGVAQSGRDQESGTIGRPGGLRSAALRHWPAGIGVAIGILAGWWIGWNSTRPSIYTELVTTLMVAGAAFLVGAFITIGLIAHYRGSSRRAGAALVEGAAAAGLAGLGAIVLVPALGLAYREPLIRQAGATVVVGLPAVTGFVPNGAGPATCVSRPDAQAVAAVSPDDLGEIHGVTLTGFVTLPHGSTQGQIQLWIDYADLPQGSIQPTWIGTGTFNLASNGSSGSVDFEHLVLPEDRTPPTGGWPAELVGRLTWRCESWPASSPPGS